MDGPSQQSNLGRWTRFGFCIGALIIGYQLRDAPWAGAQATMTNLASVFVGGMIGAVVAAGTAAIRNSLLR